MKKTATLFFGITFVAASLFAQAAQPKKCDFNSPFWCSEWENFFVRPYANSGGSYASSILKESDKAYTVNIDLPGMDKKDITIETSGNRLTISGERKEESESKDSSKRSYSQFNQSYLLPEDANLEAISASSVNGVLKIIIPKSTIKKNSKKIEIK